jgi:hypothetical protein
VVYSGVVKKPKSYNAFAITIKSWSLGHHILCALNAHSTVSLLDQDCKGTRSSTVIAVPSSNTSCLSSKVYPPNFGRSTVHMNQ